VSHKFVSLRFKLWTKPLYYRPPCSIFCNPRERVLMVLIREHVRALACHMSKRGTFACTGRDPWER